MAFPTTIDTFTPVSGTTTLVAVDHADFHNKLGTAVVAIENKIGFGSGSAAVNQILVGSGAGTSVWGSTANGLTLGSAILGTPAITGGTITSVVGTATTNNIIANGLNTSSGGTQVNISAAAAPTNGQVLMATGNTAATWQTPTAASLNFATSGPAGSFTTTSATAVDVTSATVTIVPTGSVKVHAVITGDFSLAVASTGPTIQLVIDGVTIQTISANPNFATNAIPFTVSGQATVASGSRVIKLQVTSDGNGAHGITINHANVSVVWG